MTRSPGKLRIAGGVGALLADCALSGCGASTVSTDSGKSILQRAGFHDLVVSDSQPDMNKIGDYSSITTEPGVYAPSVELLRYRSSSTAAKVYMGFSRTYFRSLISYWRNPPKLCKFCLDGTMKLPPGFQMRKLMTFQICNVILWSYNARLDPRLTARVNRAAALLRANCH
ncbi:MAG: hypothetical protein ACJ76I_04065 [Gaiellaceae bacterium]